MIVTIVNATSGDIRKVLSLSEEYLGTEANFNFIDVSKVASMHSAFYLSKFNGNISEWDTSNVREMSYMFNESKFNKDISNWNVDSLKRYRGMFEDSLLENKPEFQPKFKI